MHVAVGHQIDSPDTYWKNTVRAEIDLTSTKQVA